MVHTALLADLGLFFPQSRGGMLVLNQLANTVNYSQNKASEPGLVRTAQRDGQIVALEPLDLDQHANIVEEPVDGERDTRCNRQILVDVVHVGFPSVSARNVLIEELEQTEELPSDSHVLYRHRESFKIAGVVAYLACRPTTACSPCWPGAGTS